MPLARVRASKRRRQSALKNATSTRCMIQVLHFQLAMIRSAYVRSQDPRGGGARSVAAVDPPAPGQARLSAGESLAPASGARRGGGQERGLCAALVRAEPGGFRVAREGDRRGWR